jgi:hypothetical protein
MAKADRSTAYFRLFFAFHFDAQLGVCQAASTIACDILIQMRITINIPESLHEKGRRESS